MLAVMGLGWEDKKQGLIMTFEVPLQKKKKLNTLYDHIGIKMDASRLGYHIRGYLLMLG